LILKTHVKEISNFTIDPETLATLPVGGNREGDALIVGVDPQKITVTGFIKGRFLNAEFANEAVIGDSISLAMFSPDPRAGIRRAEPLSQSIRLQNYSFNIGGICVDPINNGKGTYISIDKLQNLTGTSNSNIVIVKLYPSVDSSAALAQIKKR
jgi:hypothetical protein